MKKFEQLKKKLKKEDFQLTDGWFERRVRPPGSMHQQQFQVSDCDSSRLSILDPSACVYIDETVNSTFFIGPCEASVFIRDCRGCTVICCCRQFRMRDCRDCRIALWCESQPVIESSQGIEFDCFPDWGYNGLGKQFQVMKFSVWNNNWWDIYDFTKKGKGMASNYKYRAFSPTELGKADFLVDLEIGGCVFQTGVVPHVYGATLKPERTIVIAIQQPYTGSFRKSDVRLIKSRRAKLGLHQSEQLELGADKWTIFLEFPAEDAEKALKLLEETGARILKKLDKLSSEQYLMIFVPFKDQH